jgi:undecaprenyl-diphosphatase
VVPNVAGSNPVDRPFFEFINRFQYLENMTLWQAFILGLIQGVTEFLPVSSSGHLALGQHFFGLKNLQGFILFDLVCHLGTLLAIFYTFFSFIRQSLSPKSQQFWQVFLGTLPLFPLVLLLQPIKSLFDHPQILGPCFLITAAFLFFSSYFHFSPQPSLHRKWRDPLAIGVFQAMAILPGVSRSGTTIAVARLLGWERENAIRFSFLLAIPAILGGTVLEIWQVWKAPAAAVAALDVGPFVVGFLASFVVGCFSLWILIRLVLQDKWCYFAWYCLTVGLFTTYYFNFL